MFLVITQIPLIISEIWQGVKIISTARSNYPEILKKTWLPILELLPFLAHLAFRPCELLSSLFVRRPSVNISHFNLLLRNHWANCNQTLVECSLDGPLPKLCPVIPTSNQDGRQAQNRKKGGWNFNCPLLL
jgi:hypothetical protein